MTSLFGKGEVGLMAFLQFTICLFVIGWLATLVPAQDPSFGTPVAFDTATNCTNLTISGGRGLNYSIEFDRSVVVFNVNIMNGVNTTFNLFLRRHTEVRALYNINGGTKTTIQCNHRDSKKSGALLKPKNTS